MAALQGWWAGQQTSCSPCAPVRHHAANWEPFCRPLFAQQLSSVPMRHYFRRKSQQTYAACSHTPSVDPRAGSIHCSVPFVDLILLGALQCDSYLADCHVCNLPTAADLPTAILCLADISAALYHDYRRDLNAASCGFGNEGLKLFVHTCALQTACSW